MAQGKRKSLRPKGYIEGLADALNGSGYTIKALSDEAKVAQASVRRALEAESPSLQSTLEAVVKAANKLYLGDAFNFQKSFRAAQHDQ